VLLHPCGGLAPFVNNWAYWVQGEGYVALVVDSFSPRGTTNVCRDGRNPTMQEVAADAFGALRYLRSLPFVDAERVGVMGWSYGAGASLLASRAGYRFLDRSEPNGKGFQAAVAFYPPCQLAGTDTATPLLMLLAGADDWTPTYGCISIGEVLQRENRPVRWVVYPNASHAFDQPGPPRTYLGHYMAYDPSATADAEKQVRRFLAEFFR
jgi:dienelactone hydrolase